MFYSSLNMKFYLIVFLLNISFGEDYVDNFEDIVWQKYYPLRHEKEYMNLTKTFFPPLKNYELKAIHIPEDKYKWIARVIHSRNTDYPYMCTASCIRQEIFVTSARCIALLKVTYSRVFYNNHKIFAKAFVFPSNGTKQAYDDIGFIIVHKRYYTGEWFTINLFEGKRTDNVYRWFRNTNFNDTHKAIGFTLQKGLHRVMSSRTEFSLTELTVFLDMDLCNEVFTFNNLMGDFNVPCYHSCTLEEYKTNNERCSSYHGSEGGAVINADRETLLGVAIWGAFYARYELPVGLAVVNSANFFEDYTCAMKIQEDETISVHQGYYQQLCNNV